MMSRIDQAFEKARSEGRSALIPFITAGDPDLEVTEALVFKMAQCGADIIELGVPFSDPFGDGPTIQAASLRAVKKDTSLEKIFRLTEKLKKASAPVVLMTYFNPVLKYGLRNLARDCARSGVDGVIIPDLPPEEASPWVKEARGIGLATIFLASPTSSSDRIRKIARSSRGFIYYVSVRGVTGARANLAGGLELRVRQVRAMTGKPIAVGFGISTPEQAKEVSRFADGVIVGSAIVRVIEENLGHSHLVDRVGLFVASLSSALSHS